MLIRRFCSFFTLASTAYSYAREQCAAELEETSELLRAEEAARSSVEQQVSTLHKALEGTRSEIQLVKVWSLASVQGVVWV